MMDLRVVVALLLVAVCAAAPVDKVVVDLTYTFDNTTQNWPAVKSFKSTLHHNETQPEGYWYQEEEISSSTHAGTHMDAPAHFAHGGTTVDRIPFERLVAPAAVIDVTAQAALDPDYGVTAEDLQHWEEETGRSLDGCILLLRTGWGAKWGDRAAYTGTPNNDPLDLHFPGLAPSAARWLVANRTALGVGVDTLSVDVGPNHGFETHLVLQGHGLFNLENVANLDQLPIHGATVYAFPMKVGQGSGAPTRIFATYPRVLFQQTPPE